MNGDHDCTDEKAAVQPRPGWQWIPIGAGFALTLWIPTVILINWLTGSGDDGSHSTARALLLLASHVAACLASGYLCARFGERATARQAASGGPVASLFVALVAAVGGGTTRPALLALTCAVLLLVALVGSSLGVFLARRTHRRE